MELGTRYMTKTTNNRLRKNTRENHKGLDMKFLVTAILMSLLMQSILAFMWIGNINTGLNECGLYATKIAHMNIIFRWEQFKQRCKRRYFYLIDLSSIVAKIFERSFIQHSSIGSIFAIQLPLKAQIVILTITVYRLRSYVKFRNSILVRNDNNWSIFIECEEHHDKLYSHFLYFLLKLCFLADWKLSFEVV